MKLSKAKLLRPPMGESKKAKKIKKRNMTSDSNEIITDSRFASVHSDPRFQKVPKHKAKVEIDSRFDRVFTDKRFASSGAPVDKRGKPKKNQDSQNFLHQYYRMEESRPKEEEEEEEEGEEEDEGKREELAKRGGEESDTESADELESDELEEIEAEGSELDTDEDDDDLLRMELDDETEEPEEQIPEIDKETHRLAVVNMDWKYVKAVDLYVILRSFLPTNGQIVSVTVYPSEFGLQCMKEEEVHGPVGLFDDESENNSDDDDDDERYNEKLRAYERSRLRYYFAVVECDSVATADYLYKACDGAEFERSSNVLDLRFIPDSMEFKHPPRDIATEAPANYENLDFQTQALQQSKIHISWDEDEPDRVKKLKRNFNADQLEELEVGEFLASDEGESDEDKKQNKRDMYRALLQSGGNASDGDDEEEGQDMEVTFNTGLEDISKRILEKKDKKQETVWEAKLREQRERKKRRKNRSKHSSEDESSDTDQEAIEEPGDFFVEEPSAKKRKNRKTAKSKKQQEDTNGQTEATRDELELLLADDTVGEKTVKGYNLKPKKLKGKGGRKVKEAMEEEKIPPIADDPRFSSLFTSPDFAMDPTDPQFKRSATYARQVVVRKQKAEEESAERESLVPAEPQAASTERGNSDAQSSKKQKYELSTLLKSVKMKSRQVKLPSNRNA